MDIGLNIPFLFSELDRHDDAGSVSVSEGGMDGCLNGSFASCEVGCWVNAANVGNVRTRR